MASTDWDLFQSLHAVMEAGSLSAGAKLRGLTQPTLGRHIEALERRLGAPLFVRSPRGLQPTELALELKPHLLEMSAAADAALRDASGAASSVTGSIRITASHMVSVEVLPPILTAFREEHPGVVIELLASNANEDLSRRVADIAVRMSPPTQGALVAKKVGDIDLGFYAAQGYVDRHGMPMSFDDLQDHAVIGFDSPAYTITELPGMNRPVGREIFSFRSDNDLAQFGALRAGFGVGVCQTVMGKRYGLTRVMPNVVPWRLTTWVVMHENLKASHRMRLMFDHLVAGLTDYVAEGRRA
jgi:DNA-binding transcriptional LysR family regulator